MNQNEKAIELLQGLGLNRLEAEVYTFLLEQPAPVTAYRAGTMLARPTANVYKAIEALARKGAVVIDGGATRLCRPTPPAEFLGQIEKGMIERTRQAADVLSRLDEAAPDEGIYRIQAAPLVLERCRAMVARAEKTAVVDAFPAALDAVLPVIRDAASRGVEVYVQTYTACSIDGAHVVLSHESEEILAHWKCEQLNVVVDGQEVLLALLHNDLSGVHQAVWTGSLYLACAMHVGLIREHTFHAVAACKERPDFPEELRRLIDRQPFFHAATIPGQQKLLARYGVISEPE